ncbi:MAG: GAF domain-containing protein, partial [Desulfovibrionaceae bacterium]|nr:GAF domain-containing protein [Desulfovibrionaceae bacterium]
CIDSKRQYAFSEKDNKILQLFAELIVKLRVDQGKEDFFTDIPRYFADLSVLQDLPYRFKRWSEFSAHFLETLVSATGFEYGAFASVEEPDKSYVIETETTPIMLQDGQPVSFPMNNGVVGWVFKNEQPLISEGMGDTPTPVIFGRVPEMNDFKAIICLPIVVEKGTRAVLCLAHRNPRHIDESMRSFVRLAVGQITAFLENLFLRTKVNSLLPKVDVHHNFAKK